jgi:hypothetical protein
MPDTIAPSPATLLLFRQFRRLGTAADGGRKPLKFNGTLCVVEDAGAPHKPHENRAVA